MDQFTAAFVEKVTEDTLVGLETFFRDANLPANVVSKYEPGRIIQETGFIDVSEFEGGPTARIRYHILTKRAGHFRKSFVQYGAWTMPRGSYFKVVDVFQTPRHAVITLLHLPMYAVPYFALHRHAQEEALVAESRQQFTEALTKPPLEAMTDDYWRRRTAFPIGIEEDGSYFFQFDHAAWQDVKTPAEGKGFWRRLFGN